MSQQHFSEHEDVLEAQGVGNIANRQQQEFATWLRQRVSSHLASHKLYVHCLH
jgi:hypothetical protein